MAEALIHAGATVEAVTRHRPPYASARGGHRRPCEGRRAAALGGSGRNGLDEHQRRDSAAPCGPASGSVAAITALLDHGAEEGRPGGGVGPYPAHLRRGSGPRRRHPRAAGARGRPRRHREDGRSRRRPAARAEAQRRQRSVMEAFEAGDVQATPSQIQAAVLAGRERYLTGEGAGGGGRPRRAAPGHRDPGWADRATASSPAG